MIQLTNIKTSISRIRSQELLGLICGLVAIISWLLWQNVGRINMIAMAAIAVVPLWYLLKYPVLGAMGYAFAIMFNLKFYYPSAPSLILFGTFIAIILNKTLREDPTWRLTPFAIWSSLLLVWWMVTITWRSSYDYIAFGFHPDAILMALVFSEIVNSEYKLRLVVVAAVIGCCATSCIIIYELLSVVKSGYLAQGEWAAKTFAGTRYFGNWQSSNPMAYTMMVGIAFSLILFLKRENVLYRLLSICGIGLCMASVFLSLTRGALLWTFLMVLLYAIASEYRRLIFTVVGVAVIVIVFAVPVTVFSRFSSHKSSVGDASLIERKILVSSGLDMMTEWFPIGAGAGTFFETSSDRVQYRSYAIGTHNSYIDVMAEMGIPGILLFVGMIAALWRATSLKIRPKFNVGFLRNYGSATRAGLIACLLSMFTENLIGFWPFWLFFTVVALRPSFMNSVSLAFEKNHAPESRSAANTA